MYSYRKFKSPRKSLKLIEKNESKLYNKRF